MIEVQVIDRWDLCMHSCKQEHRACINTENLGYLQQSVVAFVETVISWRDETLCVLVHVPVAKKCRKKQFHLQTGVLLCMSLATFCLCPSCATGPVVATLICEFFSTSVHLCCVQLCLCSV